MITLMDVHAENPIWLGATPMITIMDAYAGATPMITRMDVYAGATLHLITDEVQVASTENRHESSRNPVGIQ
jgi:hypothetical protein